MDVDLSASLLLDGATATNLMKQIPSSLCMPKWIAEHPEQILSLQKRFASLGCDVIYAPTFGASRPQLDKHGLGDEIEKLNKTLVQITKQAAESAAVAGVLSPTGLSLEPYGKSSFTEIMQAFREQAVILDNAGADLFVIETMISMSEARAAVIAVRKYKKPVFVTFTVDKNGDLPDGNPVLNALVILQELGISAFGLNCPYVNDIKSTLEQLKNYSKVPLIAKPSAFYSASENAKPEPVSPDDFKIQMQEFLRCGVSIIGGCCGTTPDHLSSVKAMLAQHFSSYEQENPKAEGDIILADTEHLYHLFCDRIECSEPIPCSIDMTDDFLRLEELQIDVITVEINSADDAKLFAENAHLASLPICIYTHDEISLRLALMLYAGRAMVDSRSSLEENLLKKLSQKYGAVVY